MRKICVLMSTYNGARYLEEQLESIVSQKEVEADIIIRDDGSKDDTRLILEKWAEKGNVRWYQGANLGFAHSFLDLVKTASDYDYYAFCDQDDIWLSDKLKRAADALDSIAEPVRLYCSNAYYYKDGQTYGAIHKSVPYFDEYTCLLRNIAPGCTMVFSRALKELLSSSAPQKIIAHDFWIFQLAVLLGKVHYDFEPGMMYRQHENNQIGQKSGFRDLLRRRWLSITSSKLRNDREKQACELLRCHGKDMSDPVREIVRTVSDYRASLKCRLALLFSSRYRMDTFRSTMYLKLRILFNSF